MNTDELSFNKVEKDDLADWLEMASALWPKSNKIDLGKEFKEVISSPREEYFICKDAKGNYLAFVDVSIRRDHVDGSKSKPVGYLEGIYVKPDYRAKGIGKKLIEIAQKWCHEKGCSEIGSDALLENIDSQLFHKSIGFKEGNKIVCFIKKIK